MTQYVTLTIFLLSLLKSCCSLEIFSRQRRGDLGRPLDHKLGVFIFVSPILAELTAQSKCSPNRVLSEPKYDEEREPLD